MCSFLCVKHSSIKGFKKERILAAFFNYMIFLIIVRFKVYKHMYNDLTYHLIQGTPKIK